MHFRIQPVMDLEEMKLAVCEKLPLKFVRYNHGNADEPIWCIYWQDKGPIELLRPVNWPTEGLQVCHEAEKLLNENEKEQTWYLQRLTQVRYKQGVAGMIACMIDKTTFATYEQRLEALCRIWWPERFTT